MEAPSADVFGRLVHLKREFRNLADGRIVEFDRDTFRFIKARYCSVSDALGSVRIRLKSPAVSAASSTRIGSRPCNSGSDRKVWSGGERPEAMNRM